MKYQVLILNYFSPFEISVVSYSEEFSMLLLNWDIDH